MVNIGMGGYFTCHYLFLRKDLLLNLAFAVLIWLAGHQAPTPDHLSPKHPANYWAFRHVSRILYRCWGFNQALLPVQQAPSSLKHLPVFQDGTEECRAESSMGPLRSLQPQPLPALWKFTSSKGFFPFGLRLERSEEEVRSPGARVIGRFKFPRTGMRIELQFCRRISSAPNHRATFPSPSTV